MTPAQTIQPWITARYRRSLGMSADGHDDVACFDDPAVLAYARAEVERLTARGINRTLAEADHESGIRCRALIEMIIEYEAILNE